MYVYLYIRGSYPSLQDIAKFAKECHTISTYETKRNETKHINSKMVSLTALLATACALLPSTLAAPTDALAPRQNAPWQWWTEGQGQFGCQQQGGGKYSCSWNGKQGGGMVAGTGWGAGRK